MRALGILQSLVELAIFGWFLWAFHAQPSWSVVWAVLFSLSAFGFVLRLRERSLATDIAEAEDKLVKRVLRRVSKVLPELLAAHAKPSTLTLEQHLGPR